MNQQNTFSGGVRGSIHSSTALGMAATPRTDDLRPAAGARSTRLSPARVDQELGADFSAEKDLGLLRGKYEDLKRQLDTEEEGIRNSFRSSGHQQIRNQHIISK